MLAIMSSASICVEHPLDFRPLFHIHHRHKAFTPHILCHSLAASSLTLVEFIITSHYYFITPVTIIPANTAMKILNSVPASTYSVLAVSFSLNLIIDFAAINKPSAS